MRPVALVTGGTKGIGRAIAAHLAQTHDVAVTWKTTEPQDGHFAIQTDLTTTEGPQAVIDAVLAEFGRLDTIINNAGLVAITPVDEASYAVSENMMALNALVPGRLLAAALPVLKRGASIVSISSTNAFSPPEAAVLYGASKAALNAWTKGTAKELGPKGIRVNAIAPGAVNIPEAPRPPDVTEGYAQEVALRRIGAPEDIAKVVGFLVSDAAGYITGEVITVSGGWRL